MCNIKENFHLCTCSPEDETEADKALSRWALYRDNSGAPRSDVTHYIECQLEGIYDFDFDSHPGKSTDTAQPLAEQKLGMILTELNQRNCFDFEYLPKPDDILTLKPKEHRSVTFRFQLEGEHFMAGQCFAGSWVIDREPYQVLELRRGTIRNDIEAEAFTRGLLPRTQ